jgi:transmembrane sensor
MKPHDDVERRIDQQAADWLIRRDRGLSAAEQDEFFQWLAADPRHGEWFARHQRTWKEFNLLAQWRPEHSAEPNPDLLAKRPSRSRRRWLAWGGPLALAAGLAVAFLLTSRSAVAPAGAPPVIAAGPRVLEDGSTVELRGDSEFRVAYTAAERRVELVRGEAFFTVAKNPARPFIVHANGVDVRAVGTAFNVRLDSERVEVLVTEGKVSVAPPATAAPLAPGAGSAPPLVVAVGERAIVPTTVAAVSQVAALSAAEIDRELAWQPRLLDFNSTPLGEVVAEFNSRNRTRLVLADPGLAALPIVASVRSDNVEGFVRLLEATAGVRAERRDDTITLHAAR